MSTIKAIKTPDATLAFNALVNPSSYKDPKNPDKVGPARYTVQAIFSGDAAKEMVKIAREQCKLIVPAADGTVKLSFNRPESFGAPKLVDKDGKPLPEDHGQPFFKAGVKIQVAFTPYTYEAGAKGSGNVSTAFRLEAVRFIDDYKLPPLEKSNDRKSAPSLEVVDLEGLFG